MATLSIIAVLLILATNKTFGQKVNCRDAICSCPSSNLATTCILDCDNADICKESTLNCRPGDPCRIQCSDTASCSSGTTINAATATDVTIVCNAVDACKDGIDIICGTGRCQLHCLTKKACIDWGSIDTSKSFSFQCFGDCPKNIPAAFGPQIHIPTLKPTLQPTLKPSMKPTLKPTTKPPSKPASKTTIKPAINTLNTPTTSPFSYFIVGDPEYVDKDTTDKDLATSKKKTLQVFDIAIIGAGSMGFCIACVFTVWLCNRLKNKRSEHVREGSKSKHKRYDSLSNMNNIQTNINNMKMCSCNSEADKNLKDEWYGQHPSMEMIINAKQTAIMSPILSIKDTNGGDVKNMKVKQLNDDMQLESSFTIDTVENQNQHITMCHSKAESISLNNSESGTDYIAFDARKKSSDSAIKINNSTPPALPCIPDNKSVNHLIDSHQINALPEGAMVESKGGKMQTENAKNSDK